MLDKEVLVQIQEDISKDEYASYINEGRHFDLANKLNDTLVVVDKPVSIATLNSFGDSNGLLLGLEDVVSDNENKFSKEIKFAARAILRVFTARYDTVDLTLLAVKSSFDALVAANVLTKDNVDKIYALGKISVSLSERRYGVKLNSSDIADALKV